LRPGLRDDWGFREAYPPLVGRETLLQEVQAVLAQETERMAVALVGPSGVGKTALVRELAWCWQEEHPDGKALWVDTPALLAGAAHAADLRERVHQLYATVHHFGSSALLIMEDLHLLYADALLSLELRHAVEAGVHVCGTLPPDGLAALTNPALRRRLRLLNIPEPSRKDLARVMLPPVARHLENRYGVRLSREALSIALDVSNGQPGAQPAKVIQLLDRALARARRRHLEVLGPDDVLEGSAEE
jgi:ATP-dependent Clp protease ATP-binding subunit ClpA